MLQQHRTQPGTVVSFRYAKPAQRGYAPAAEWLTVKLEIEPAGTLIVGGVGSSKPRWRPLRPGCYEARLRSTSGRVLGRCGFTIAHEPVLLEIRPVLSQWSAEWATGELVALSLAEVLSDAN